MISVNTDEKGTRWIHMPRGLADVATEIFPQAEPSDAVFRLADSLPLSALHTAERICLNRSHADAVEFVRRRLALVTRAVLPDAVFSESASSAGARLLN